MSYMTCKLEKYSVHYLKHIISEPLLYHAVANVQVITISCLSKLINFTS